MPRREASQSLAQQRAQTHPRTRRTIGRTAPVLTAPMFSGPLSWHR